MTEHDLDVEIRQIEPGDRLTGLSLGSEDFLPLKIFLQSKARLFHEGNLAKTYAAFKKTDAKIIAYVTLVCGEVAVADDERGLLLEDQSAYNYRQYPAIKIARLAVDRRYRGYDLGTTLVNLALGIAKDVICPAVGCRFVVVDSKKASVKFYERKGFTFLDTKSNRERSEPVMFMDLHKIAT